MADRKTHLLRARPPWRDGLDITVCGRKVTPVLKTAVPGADMAREAAKWALMRRKSADAPDMICTVCYEKLGCYGRENWNRNPLAVLQADIKSWNPAARDALRRELLALASLAASHPDEFRRLLTAERVMAALAGC